MYARQMGYLHARPRLGHSKQQPKSRLQQLRDQGTDPPMPPVPIDGRYLIEQFHEVGPASHGAMGGLLPVTFAEMEAWQQATAVELLPWEARLLRRLSCEYVAQYAASDAPECPAPWTSGNERAREDVSRRVRLIFGARAKKQ